MSQNVTRTDTGEVLATVSDAYRALGTPVPADQIEPGKRYIFSDGFFYHYPEPADADVHGVPAGFDGPGNPFA